ncbi:MAG: hypothetical protein V4724_18560 [Pseudomonadota bacterium]
MSISKLLLACAVALGSMTLCPGAALADTKHPESKKAAKPVKSKAKTAAPVAPKAPDEEADEPAVADFGVTEFDCELGNKITIYQNTGDDSHIALRWKKRLHRLTRVGTTTGAQRFENKLYGLIWIGIPAKGMLLDSKQNRQLANECRNAEQSKPADSPAPAPAPTSVAAPQQQTNS